MLEKLLDRFDNVFLRKRMGLQVDLVARLLGAGVGSLHFENLDILFPVLRTGLKAVGLWEQCLANTRTLTITHNVVHVSNLPPAFSGLRILHLSDIHLDSDPRYGPGPLESIAAAAPVLDFDLCLITGDFRYRHHGPYDRIHSDLERLMPSLDCELGVYGILGNHDFVEQVMYFEAAGVTMLVNEAAAVERDGERLFLVGLDDPHFYGTHDFVLAFEHVPRDSCVVCMVHSPEVADEAAKRGSSLYLCGHTHGGQLCLPGGFAPFVNARCPRERVVGKWKVGRMHGYTSAGSGSSGLPVRMNRPPEIAIHELG